MCFFAKKEVLNTFSYEKFTSARSSLSQNNISYSVKVVDQSGAGPFESTRTRAGSYGLKQDWVKQYYVFVDKKDYEKALYVIQ